MKHSKYRSRSVLGTALALVGLVASLSFRAFAANVGLTWDPNSEPDLAGYRLYRGTSPGLYDWLSDIGLVTANTVGGLTPGTTYYFAVTAYNSEGLESNPSNEVVYTVPADAGGGSTTAPLAADLQVYVPEDSQVAVTLAATDPDADPLTFSITALPAHGVLVGAPPNLSYRPAPNYFGQDSFQYVANDGNLDSAPAEVLLTVTAVNDPPVAIPRSVTVTEDALVAVPLSGTDVEGTPLSYIVTRLPTKGVLTGVAPTLYYRPQANYFGSDSVEFAVRDDATTSAPALITINVSAVNDRPVASPISQVVPQNGSAPVTLLATDVESSTLTYTVTQQPVSGTLSGTPPFLTYTPAPGFLGTDSFFFAASDGFLTSVAAKVTLTVSASSGNRSPIAVASSATVAEDGSVATPISATDPDGDPISYTITSAPANGSITGLAPNLSYRPRANFSGSDSFSFTATDGTLTSAPATVSITVTPVNDPPVASGGSSTVTEDGVLPITLTGSDVEGTPLTFTILTVPGKGTLTGTPPNLTYRPALNYFGSDSFTYTVRDDVVTSAPATFVITVSPVNDRPIANNGSVSAPNNTSVAITLTASDVEASPLTYRIVTPPAFGTLTGTPPNLTYTANAGYVGPDSISFTAGDATLTSAAASISISVVSGNRPPVASALAVTAPEDTSVPILLTGTDPDGAPVTWTIVRPPANGTISGSVPSIVYQPRANYTGTDSFDFVVSDGVLTTPPTTASITVTPVNDPPTALAANVTVTEDEPASIILNGTDVETPVLSYAVSRTPLNGTLTGTVPNLTYLPRANFFGTDSFEFRVSDGGLPSQPATVTITVVPQNDPPTSTPQSLSVLEDTSIPITLSGSDIEASALTFAVTTPPQNGTLTGSPPNLIYQPAADFNGTDTFEFTANDGELTSLPAIVSVRVNPSNDPPAALPLTLSVSEDIALPITLAGQDIDSTALTFAIRHPPTNGTLSGTAPNLVYQPKPNFSGGDSFEYTAFDGVALSSAALVSITVDPVNDAPIATPRSVSLTEDSTIPITLTGTDVDNSNLIYGVTRAPTRGTLTGAPPNLTYRPDLNYSGTDSFEFTVSDGLIVSAAATVSIQVSAVNDAPVALSRTVTVIEDTSTPITLQGTDVEGSPLAFALSRQPLNGVLSGTPPSLIYIPRSNFAGTDSFDFTVSDGLLTSAIGTVSISVTPVNDRPVATPKSVSVLEDGSVAITLTGTDVDGNRLTFAVTVPPTRGSITGSSPTFTYRPNTNFAGLDSFQFVANDLLTSSVPASVSITVLALNDAPSGIPASYTVQEDSGIPIVLSGTDPEQSPLTYVISRAPPGGILSGTPPNITYTPRPNFNGSDSFEFTCGDGALVSAPTLVTVAVLPANDPPTALGQSIDTAPGSAVAIQLTGNDVDLDPITYRIVTAPTRGTLTGTAPTLQYTPAVGATSGQDSFTFAVSDGILESVPATVQIRFVATSSSTLQTPETLAIQSNASGTTYLVSNADPALGDSPVASGRFLLASPPQHGSVTLAPSGLVEYKHLGDAAAEDRFSVVSLKDGTLGAPKEYLVAILRILSLQQDGDDTILTYPVTKGVGYQVQVCAVSPSPDAPWETLHAFAATQSGEGVSHLPPPPDDAPRFVRVISQTDQTIARSEVWGYQRISHFAQSPLYSLPFQGPLALQARVKDVATDSVGLLASLSDPIRFRSTLGFPSHVAMLRNSDLDEGLIGEWWPILNGDGERIVLDSRSEDLSQVLKPDDQLDIVRLVTLADIFGIGSAPNHPLSDGDRILFHASDGSFVSVQFRTSEPSQAGYYLTREGRTSGPVDGTDITLLPAQGFEIVSAQTTLRVPFLGRVQPTRLVQYLTAIGQVVGNPFPSPLTLPIVNAGRIDPDALTPLPDDRSALEPLAPDAANQPGNNFRFRLIPSGAGIRLDLPTGQGIYRWATPLPW